MSKLTIIIPLLKKPEYLTECLDSIALQNQHNIEVLIVSDIKYEELEGEMEQYCKQYASKFKLSHVVCEEGNGLGAVRNYGCAKSDGEYLYFMEEEDCLAPDTITSLLEAVESMPADMVYSKVSPMYRLASGYHEEYEEEIQLIKETDYHKLSKRPAIERAQANFDKTPLEYMIECRDEIEDYSVLGVMFNKKYLEQNDIHFSNDIKYYPDAPFLCNCLVNAKECKVIQKGAYIRRNGTFHYRVEQETDLKGQLRDYMVSYDLAYSYCISNLGMMALVQETMCSKYINTIIRYLCKTTDTDWQKEVYDGFSKQMQRVDKRVVNCFGKLERKHLLLLLKGRLKSSISYMNTYIKRKKRENIRKNKNNRKRSFAMKAFGSMDVLERYIVFESGGGHRYYGDPKYIYHYLMNNYPGEYRCIWVVSDKKVASRIDGNCILVKSQSLRYFYYVLRAKYWISDARPPIWWYKSDEQQYIYTGLGTPMQKQLLDKKAFHDGPKAFLRGLKAQVEQWNVALSGNELTTKMLESGFGAKKEQVLNTGNPRNDLLLADNVEQRETALKERLGIPTDKKTILYAPVWREEEKTDVEGCYQIHLGLYRMRDQLSDEYVVLLRFHDYITDKVVLDKALEGFIYDFSFYDDVQELLLISDILITDYSSIIFDYACLNRPMFFYVYDYEEYRKKEEYFYYLIEEGKAPGPICHTTQEMIDQIKELSTLKQKYEEVYTAFRNEFCDYSYGSAERFARNVLTEMNDIFEYEDDTKSAQQAENKKS